ncbi:kinesin-like protein KIN-7O [Abrus precatorius]|uniref:Kinesin-like protein KIN-7O n=1 Tax=Abrus precatorius TaxID=3816 RepID=A0A8B8K099_ABRPR|nr:kinesin-like protein KIN-7O [Abrus precatorius]
MERIHVSVRIRPLSSEDTKTSPWRVSANSIFIPNHSSKFEFDQIFSENCKTAQVYEARTKDIVEAAVRGFNGTVFAYGQTNSGKTYTMRGSKAEPGVIPLAIRDLFHIIQRDVDREFLLRMSYMEIYNEEINDLLAPEHRKLQIHENLERGIYVAGLREEIVASPEQVVELMEFGESHRHIGETNMNLYSSRSHTIFRMIIESRDRREDEESGSSCDAVRVSVLNLVDLAGSERAAKTGAEGVRLKEGSHINKSLMTLGTVIKKLSEGAEGQGGHVPYRDSKLTRILQPALGGNANTAIICNITLAQIHTDETKSSLQFASRALRVTNCAQVNEILTDAALLKRQKKEIEELRAKLMGSHSEHWEEEILNLRNTLLQTELERERIALELEEEKKNQAEWEKRVKEQAKKIENLSSMVLFSSRDESREHIKKEKRRDTLCLGKLSREHLRDVSSSIQPNASTVKQTRPKQDIGLLLPFEELVNEDVYADESFKQEDDDKGDVNENYNLPNPCSLLHVTNRKKATSQKKSLSMEDTNFLELQAEYENLLLKFETQRTMSEIQIESLRKQLIEANSLHSKESTDCLNNPSSAKLNGEKNLHLRELEAILVIKRLQEQIKVLEKEKLSSQQSLDNVVDLATEQNICTKKKFEKLYEELINAQEAARLANEQLTSSETVSNIIDGNFDFIISVSMGIQEIVCEILNSKEAVQSVILMVDDAMKNFSALCEMFLAFKTSMLQNSSEQSLVLSNHQKLNSCLREKLSELEYEKECLKQEKIVNAELISYIQTFEKDIPWMTSSSMMKEMETLRKDLENAKTKLKETESKLEIAIQEKEKLERQRLEEYDLNKENLKSSIKVLMEEKEELAMQLTDALLQIEEERAIWSAKEKAALLAIEEQAKSNNVQIKSLSTKLSEVRNELESYREECRTLQEKLSFSHENACIKESFREKVLELDQPKIHLETVNAESKLHDPEKEKANDLQREMHVLHKGDILSHPGELDTLSKNFNEFQNLKNKLYVVTKEKDKLTIEMEDQPKHLMEMEFLHKHCLDEVSKAKVHVEELSQKISCMEVKRLADEVTNNKERSKLRMRLRGTQAKLDAFRCRYKEAIDESVLMNKRYGEAAGKLKDQLASKGIEVLNLMKQLAAAKGQ